MNKFFETEPVIFSTGGGEEGLSQDTIGNMRRAIKAGADVVRSNAALTEDKKIILYSDAVFKNEKISATGISSLRLEELKEMQLSFLQKSRDEDASENRKGIFPELAEVLTTFPEQRFNINFPDVSPETTELSCNLIIEMNAQQRILASSMNGPVIKKIRALVPDMPTSFSFTEVVGFYALYRSGFLYFKKKFAPEALVIHEMIGASFIGSSGVISEAKKRGIKVYILNIDKEEQARRLREAGADGFVTGVIETVKKALV